MFERFARQSREAVVFALEEAGRRGDRKVGTEHLLFGTLHDPEAAQLAGVGPSDVRRVEEELDREALSAVGVEVDEFGPLAPAAGAARLPFTPGAKAVLRRALGHAAGEKSRTIDARHLLAALRECEKDEAAAVVLEKLRKEG
ncbi:Clp protease N-terminal domain-containing protein [Arthrobacter sp. NPDC090010]|uniref:Clp protease N-terminal domain-containing protein n=1 Tax=Arthrobacter sp. NPDC090010 TaxID=3363942 RepID=UPI003813C654